MVLYEIYMEAGGNGITFVHIMQYFTFQRLNKLKKKIKNKNHKNNIVITTHTDFEIVTTLKNKYCDSVLLFPMRNRIYVYEIIAILFIFPLMFKTDIFHIT